MNFYVAIPHCNVFSCSDCNSLKEVSHWNCSMFFEGWSYGATKYSGIIVLLAEKDGKIRNNDV